MTKPMTTIDKLSCPEDGFDPERDEDDQALEGWAFNVCLECFGRDDTTVAIGGAILDLRDLHRILQWARGRAEEVLADAGNGDAS